MTIEINTQHVHIKSTTIAHALAYFTEAAIYMRRVIEPGTACYSRYIAKTRTLSITRVEGKCRDSNDQGVKIKVETTPG